MVARMQCPICGGNLADGRPIDVCTACHKSLTGAVAVRATGEFMAPSPGAIDAAVAGELSTAARSCLWCGKDEHQVRKLLGRKDASICNECVKFCVDILDEELGTWR
jgi:hypothetical protein